MRIIRPESFKIIEDVRLNRGGKIIGQIVRLDTDYYYKSYRTDAHYFIKFKGFGVDSTLFMKLLDKRFQNELQKRLGVKKYIRGVIIEYQGKREHRFYFADMDTWFMNKIDYGTAKLSKDDVEAYGRQFILSKKHMTVLGVAPDDYSLVSNGSLGRFVR